MKTIDRFYSFVATIIIISFCCTFVLGWFPIFAKRWIWALFLTAISILFYKNNSKFIFPLLIYGVVLYFNVLGGDEKFDFVYSTMEFLGFFLSSYLFCIYSSDNYFKARKVFLGFYLLVLFVTFVGTLFFYIKDPELLRIIQYASNGGDTTFYWYYAKFGVESYSMGHALPCLIPIIVYAIKKKFYSRYKMLLLLFVVVALVVMSTATTAVLISIILLILSFLYDENNIFKTSIVLLICSCILTLFLVNRELLLSILNSMNFESAETYAGKIRDFQEYATYGKVGGQTQGRLDLYKESLDVFISSPLIGVNSTKIGGHSAFFDRLAMLGLVGFLSMILYLYFYVKLILRRLSRNFRPYYIFGLTSFILMGMLKAIFSLEYIIITLFIMPLACLFFDKNINLNEKS